MRKIWKYSNKNGFTHESDLLTDEEPLAIIIRHRSNEVFLDYPLSITMRTRGSEQELAIGFLITEGIVPSIDHIEQIEIGEASSNQLLNDQSVTIVLKTNFVFDPEQFRRNFFASSSCGVCGKASVDQLEGHIRYIPTHGKPLVTSDFILSLDEVMRKSQRVFNLTGGIHGTAAFDVNGDLQVLEEDVGRHNAMDKVIGKLALNHQLPAREKIVSVSGRAGFELVQKALIAGFPIMTAVGAPSRLAVELAEVYGMTLIGFLKKDKFNIYCHPERIAGAT
ncbi:MAG: formate dehydrogenase accessory sulfurtransferase FdhD [Saprospirales bacterium]|nr:MAG: formate dehydrogenase accessory sulfurtransferase FdhD [Saprospirales bacterium]